MKVSALLLIAVTFVSTCSAQSSGGGGGAVVGIFAVVCCPCITVVAIVFYFLNRCNAHSTRKSYLQGTMEYHGDANELVVPRDGHYDGRFIQGDLAYRLSLHLQFVPKNLVSTARGTIQKYKVVGHGDDDMGEFTIKRGECNVGKSIRLTFSKRYNGIKSPFSTNALTQLVYTGILESDSITGQWEFVGQSTGKDEHGNELSMSGSWSVTHTNATSKGVTPGGFETSTPNATTPLIGAINLTKEPLPV